MRLTLVKRLLVGAPMPLAQARHERLGKAVALAVFAGIAALTSAAPQLHPYRVVLSVLAVAGIALGNLRGVRESGRLFAAPTYFFVFSILGMVGYGLIATALDLLPEAPYEPH